MMPRPFIPPELAKMIDQRIPKYRQPNKAEPSIWDSRSTEDLQKALREGDRRLLVLKACASGTSLNGPECEKLRHLTQLEIETLRAETATAVSEIRAELRRRG